MIKKDKVPIREIGAPVGFRHEEDKSVEAAPKKLGIVDDCVQIAEFDIRKMRSSTRKLKFSIYIPREKGRLTKFKA